MAWTEPLLASSSTTVQPAGDQPGTIRVIIRANGTAVVFATVLFDQNSKCVVMGPIVHLNRTGTIRQRVRAMSLLLRECVRASRQRGMLRYFAESIPEGRPIIEAICHRMRDAGARAQAEGLLFDLEGNIATNTETDGRIKGKTPAEEALLIVNLDLAP